MNNTRQWKSVRKSINATGACAWRYLGGVGKKVLSNSQGRCQSPVLHFHEFCLLSTQCAVVFHPHDHGARLFPHRVAVWTQSVRAPGVFFCMWPGRGDWKCLFHCTLHISSSYGVTMQGHAHCSLYKSLEQWWVSQGNSVIRCLWILMARGAGCSVTVTFMTKQLNECTNAQTSYVLMHVVTKRGRQVELRKGKTKSEKIETKNLHVRFGQYLTGVYQNEIYIIFHIVCILCGCSTWKYSCKTQKSIKLETVLFAEKMAESVLIIIAT